MIDYLSHPVSSLKRVFHPGQQRIGHPHNDVAWGVPQQLLSRYYRPAKANGDPEWWLDADSPRWADELLPYQAALALYADKPAPKPAFALAAEMEADRRRVAREQYRAAVRALPGGMDPLWRYSSDGDDVAGENDLRFMIGQHTVGGWTKTWWPRIVLRTRYGTTSLREYAERNGVSYPV